MSPVIKWHRRVELVARLNIIRWHWLPMTTSLKTLLSFGKHSVASIGSWVPNSCQVPVIGGKELNLHVLYIEVTNRGGFDKVVTMKKWRDVRAIFGFSSTTTSASYALRKRYSRFLYQYELTYFLRSKPSAHSGCLSFEANGIINTKFEHGYLVTMQLDSEILHGVLYHPQHNAIVPYNINSNNSRKRKRRKYKSDPKRPKTNRSGYNFFFAEKHAELKLKYPENEREFTKMIGESWNNLSPEDKMVYQKQGLKDKERYQRELAEYKKKSKTERCKFAPCGLIITSVNIEKLQL